ncbi:TetR/AcrR family transcriptional regulator [Haloarcula onubensis]|uniref:TetR/AcrR family transcriptional regulator n=1 Tax=Haloarcula onubensis TaxID=2950539 RepID=A0ABU2FPP2_9EURY|nr:TetR/AcrR family transcriptional regulator [Halomicroarcula sp. S3CR25-11]MDS0282714.1 TetR/AcrR family transcriptional regulator [Halomicroarcula sp. S3CR25-11]
MSSESTAEIMAATGRALCEHGYADLTMQRIADESSVTSAAIHYHFDTKEELLNAFLDDLLDRFESRLACEARDPRDRLTDFLDAVFEESSSDHDDFPVALMELKAQAPYHDLFRERFVELDEVVCDVVGTAVRDGIEDGHFDDADPDEVARLVATMINGAHVRSVALGERTDRTRETIEGTLALHLGWTPGSEVAA